MGQRDDQRRYFLARKAECFYLPTEARYGAPVRLRAVVTSSEKCQAAARISVTSGGQPLAEIEVTHTILTKVTFEAALPPQAHSHQSGAQPLRGAD